MRPSPKSLTRRPINSAAEPHGRTAAGRTGDGALVEFRSRGGRRALRCRNPERHGRAQRGRRPVAVGGSASNEHERSGACHFGSFLAKNLRMATSETMNSALCPTSTPASYPVLAVGQPHLISSARTKPFTLRFLVVDRLRATLAQVGCDDGSEIIHPPPDGLVRDHNPALGEQVFDIAEAEREPEVQPNRLVNDLRREPVARVADFLRIRCRRASLPCSSVSRATPYQRICRSDAVRRNRSPTGCAPW